MMRHRLYAGSSAWLIQRLSGILLTFFLILHLTDTARRFSLKMPGLMSFVTGTPGRLILLALVVVHGLNGIRVLLVEAGLPTRLHKPALWLAAFLGIIIILAGA